MSVAPGRFLTGSTMGHVVYMTLTGAAGITFVFIVDAANLFWISQLGDPALVAAIGFAFAIQFFSVSAGIGLMIAATALVSRHIGAGDRAEARRMATSAAVIAFVIQSTVAALLVLFRHEIVAMSGATGDTARLAARYLAMSVPSLGMMAVAMIASGTLRAEGDGRRSMYVTLASGMFAMVVDPILIFVVGLGLDGAAIGLILSRCAMVIVALYFATRVHDLMARPALSDVSQALAAYLAIALPAIVTQMATPVGNYLLTRVMAPFGDEAVAGWAVVGRLTVVAFGGIFSLAGAIGGIFGQNYGARQFDRVRRTYRDALIFGLIYTLVTWAVLVAVSGTVTRGFALTPEGAEVVRAFTHVGAGAFVFAAALFVSNAAFNALGRPLRATLTNWLRDGVLTLPLGLWMAGVFGATGVIYAQAAAGAAVGLFAAIWAWVFVRNLSRDGAAASLDPVRARPYAHADRFRRR
jgi:putative MATE family efflux protein